MVNHFSVDISSFLRWWRIPRLLSRNHPNDSISFHQFVVFLFVFSPKKRFFSSSSVRLLFFGFILFRRFIFTFFIMFYISHWWNDTVENVNLHFYAAFFSCWSCWWFRDFSRHSFWFDGSPLVRFRPTRSNWTVSSKRSVRRVSFWRFSSRTRKSVGNIIRRANRRAKRSKWIFWKNICKRRNKSKKDRSLGLCADAFGRERTGVRDARLQPWFCSFCLVDIFRQLCTSTWRRTSCARRFSSSSPWQLSFEQIPF